MMGSNESRLLGATVLAVACAGLLGGCGDGMLNIGWGDGRSSQAHSESDRYVPPSEVEEAGASQAGNIQYDDADQCIGTGNPLLPGTDRLARHLMDNFNGTSRYSETVYCRQIVGGSSLSTHATGRAIDLFIPTVGGDADNDVGDPVANYLIRNATELGVQYFIWDRTQWNTEKGYSEDYCRSRCWEHGGGKHPHHDHLHIELSKHAAQNLNSFPPIGGATTGGGTSGGSTGGTSGGTSGGSSGGGTSVGLPPAPSGLAPADGTQTWSDAVSLSADAVSGGTGYQFELDYWDGQQWREYYDYEVSQPSKTVWPYLDNNAYRVRIRAKTSAGWGGFSGWNVFLFGSAEYPGQSSSSGGTTQPASDAPTGSSPSAEKRIWGDDVTMSCDAVSGASDYEFEIDYYDGTGWRGYYVYETGDNAKTFWPYVDNTPYRWRVRAYTSSGWTDYSRWNVFLFGNASGL